MRQQQYGGDGFINGIFGLLAGFRRPAVETKEVFDWASQVGVPIGKAKWLSVCAAVFLFTLWGITLTIDPEYIVEGVTYVLGIAAFIMAVLGILFWSEAQLDRRPKPVLLAIVACVALGAMTAAWSSQNHDGWWLADIHPKAITVIRILCGGVMVGSGMGAFGFIREIIEPFQLTGFDRVIGRLVDTLTMELAPHISSLIMAEMGIKEDFGEKDKEEIVSRVGHLVNDSLKEAQRIAGIPIDKGTPVTQRRLRNALWHFDLSAFLWITCMDELALSRNQLVDEADENEYLELPSGLVVKDVEYRVIINALEKAEVLFTAARRAPQINSDLSPEKAAHNISLLEAPEKPASLKAHYK